MVGKIKVNLIDETHSVGRGVGFYAQFLKEALSHLPSVELTRKNPDIVHYPYFDLFYPTLPFIKKIPSIVTIHDLIPLVFPKLYPKGIRAMMALFWQRIALGNVSAIVTDSLASKRDIVKLFNVNPKKVFVTPLSVDPVFQEEPTPKQIAHVKAKYDLPEKFVLYVGGINPNKNLVRLAEVAEKMNLPVVFIGSEFKKTPKQTFSVKRLFGLQKTHPEIKEFQKLQAIINNTSLFKALGFVPTVELNAIYRLATMYCQPSLYEGFGLPLLEAMTAGCVIVSSNTSSLPEIYHQGALTFDPTDLNEMEEVLSKALSLTPSQKEDQIKAGKKRSLDFSWEKTAQETVRVYKQVLCR